MDILSGFFFSTVTTLVVAALVVGAVVVAQFQADGGAGGGAAGAIRRVYYYGLGFVALMVAASGVRLLLAALAEAVFGSRVLAGGESLLAMGLAMALVGTPLWLLQWGLAQRSVDRHPAEARALTRKLYIYLVLGVSAAMAASGLVSLLAWLLGSGEFQGTHVANPLVWGAIWGLHWRVEQREGQPGLLGPTVRRLYVYTASLYGLAMLGWATGTALSRLLGEAYAVLFASSLGLGAALDTPLWDRVLQGAGASGLVGAAWWWWHWHRLGRADTESLLRQVYLYLFAVLGGAVTVVASLGVALHSVLQWAIGAPEATRAAVHFDLLPGTIAAGVVGVGLWAYHWAVVHQEAAAEPKGLATARRVYRYLVSGLGLGTLGGGLVALLATLLGMAAPDAGRELGGSGWWRNPLALAITLLAVGGPVWGYFWTGVQREALHGPLEERSSLARRVFVYVVFGAAMLTALGSLSALLFIVFRAALQGTLSLEVLESARWGIAFLLTAGAGGVYYWLVVREERRAGQLAPSGPASAPRARKTVVALLPEGALGFVEAVEGRLGYGVRRWHRTDLEAVALAASAAQVEEAVRRIADAPGNAVLLSVDSLGLHVVPFREG